ncbi:hypothetical protein UFOVP435_69 [uncultured Caudovirales phage]|uniref:DUF932 domain-containing protein n=1 Tax=uncultured Caudovirales phage TaxID=2100421 RepID=A0A6J5MAF3_9CAUD|nr:hypothetical protein UFOVP435_69 [uncultured Caudovirales phage]
MTAVAKATSPKAKGHKIDASRGSRDGRVSNEWFKRGDDERFTSLEAIEQYTTKRSADLRETILTKSQIKAVGTDKGLFLETPEGLLAPTHSGFGSLCYYGASPAEYLRRLPAGLAAQCLNDGLAKAEVREDFKLYHSNERLVGMTGPKFGRVYDADVVKAVRQLAGNGTGDTDWKVPGQIDWMNNTYNSSVDIDKDTTTLYASDKDVFMFLVNDKHPISIGKLPNGDDDLVFRGFYVWNCEIGGKSLGLSTFMLRGVCQNRNLWGVEDQQTFTIRHTAGAPIRFDAEFAAQLGRYAGASAKPVQDKVREAKKLVVAGTQDSRIEFLQRAGLNKVQAAAAIIRGIEEEGCEPTTLWDMTMSITALARFTAHTDTRLQLEQKAASLMGKIKVPAAIAA